MPPIPAPLSQRWRELRIRVLPVFVFTAATLGLASLWNSYVHPIGAPGGVTPGTAKVSGKAQTTSLVVVPEETADTPAEQVTNPEQPKDQI